MPWEGFWEHCLLPGPSTPPHTVCFLFFLLLPGQCTAWERTELRAMIHPWTEYTQLICWQEVGGEEGNNGMGKKQEGGGREKHTMAPVSLLSLDSCSPGPRCLQSLNPKVTEIRENLLITSAAVWGVPSGFQSLCPENDDPESVILIALCPVLSHVPDRKKDGKGWSYLVLLQ